MKARSPGFTLAELLVTLSVLTTLLGGLWAYYLEARVASARLEAQVAMERNASLAVERIGRRLRGAASVREDGQGVAVVGLDGATTRFVVEGGALVEDSAGERLAFARMFSSVRAEETPAGFRLHLVLERPLIQARTVRVDRTIFVGRRK